MINIGLNSRNIYLNSQKKNWIIRMRFSNYATDLKTVKSFWPNLNRTRTDAFLFGQPTGKLINYIDKYCKRNHVR